MKIWFLVNTDSFFDSHRRGLQLFLNKYYTTEILVGNTNASLNYDVTLFKVKNRIPTIRGLLSIFLKVVGSNSRDIFIVVTPMMILITHLLFPFKRNVIYNFSGLGFIRKFSSTSLSLFFRCFFFYPSRSRKFVVQNRDDFKLLSSFIKDDHKNKLILIPGSGFQQSNHLSVIPQHYKPKTIGYVGRIRKDKGIVTLIKSFENAQKFDPDLRLVIWGQLDNPKRHGFSHEELKLLDSRRKYFRGFSVDKMEIFNSFSWFCLPSNGEGISKAAIEATAFSKPLILSKVPGNSDMIFDNGFLFKYESEEDLTNLFKQIGGISDIEYERLSSNSFKAFKNNWSEDRIHEHWFKLIKSV